ncbi:energy-coupling factor ABC transporter substrate-binding protein [Streptomonospora nanhaiensis]|uniref:Cobalt transport protein CbiN n=1 Tax=Streptomonospora nanhaiensis TaxID=1323731 RepID=A0A853BUL0_9ACTN|nr:energy-coupling factor ABC transporter substrate-binding protein [Streptomonospora nanhaiensis]MBV2365490.1 energy-coupling factor ABC transporter substrate-binding protein [Streptomonospora nanhaiensis]MBX9390812.1 energy-coupling factor ABC transporter substrate-binding protein [Streptomonospora nanhaiensis]NYI98435.1 cobalt/nickel transport protein [Streptomonospora nanhaiensis]
MPRTLTTWLLIAAAAAIAVLPVLIGAADHLPEPFPGADAEAEEAVQRIDPDYEPWFTPVYEAPSSEIESGLFALQAAIGAGIIGYCFGVLRTRRRLERSGAPGTRAAEASAPGGGPGAKRGGAAR